VREHTPGADHPLPSVFPEHAVEIVVECAIDLEERVEVVVKECAIVISEVVCDLTAELDRGIRGRHCGCVGVGVVEIRRARLGFYPH
jgi:hypothetical protein